MATKLKKEHIEKLTKIIKHWNSDRLDLFEISLPNKDGEFYGVMRFYFQEEGEKVATKCIRVTSTATTLQAIETLIEKFRPDLRLLSRPCYSLYEVHVNGDERKLEDDEKPLLVQLNWNKDDREGRFLLKREDDEINNQLPNNNGGVLNFGQPQSLDLKSANGYPTLDRNRTVKGNQEYEHQARDSFFSTLSSGTLFRNNKTVSSVISPKLFYENERLNQTTADFRVLASNGDETTYSSFIGSELQYQDDNDTLVSCNNASPRSKKGNLSNSANISFGAAMREKATNTFRRSKNKKKEKQSKNLKDHKKEHNLGPANGDINCDNDAAAGKISDKLYQAMPETSFTRSISNPEAVMRRRRQQKLEKKLKLIQNLDQKYYNQTTQIQTSENGSAQGDGMARNQQLDPIKSVNANGMIPSGGMLRVYGDTLKPGIPYKTLLLTNQDTAKFVVKEILDKYGMYPQNDPEDYCLFKAHLSKDRTQSNEDDNKETLHNEVIVNYKNLTDHYILEDADLPLVLYCEHLTALPNKNSERGREIFYVSRKPSNYYDILNRQRDAFKEARQQQQHLYSIPSKIIINNQLVSTDPNNRGNMTNQFGIVGTHGTPHGLMNEFDHHPNQEIEDEEYGYGEKANNSHQTLALNESVSIYEKRDPKYLDQLTQATSQTPEHHENYVEDSLAKQSIAVDYINERYPLLIELTPDGNEVRDRKPFIYQIDHNFIEIGSQKASANTNTFLQLQGDDIYPKHCLLTRSSGELTVYVTPCKIEAVIYLNGKLVRESTQIPHNASVRFGLSYAFKFLAKPPLTQNYNVALPSPGAHSQASLQNVIEPTKSASSFGGQQDHKFKFPDHMRSIGSQGSSSNVTRQQNDTAADFYNNHYSQEQFIKHMAETESLPAFLLLNERVGIEVLIKAIFGYNDVGGQVSPGHTSTNVNAILYAWGSTFQLSIAYLLYLCCRAFYNRRKFLISNTDYTNQELHCFLSNLIPIFSSEIEARKDNPLLLTFWIANLSETHYVFTHDVGIAKCLGQDSTQSGNKSPIATTTTLDSPMSDKLKYNCIYLAFYLLTRKLCFDIATLLPCMFYALPQLPFNDNSGTQSYQEAAIKSSCSPIIKTLNSLMNMLKNHRLNSAITIQVFVRIFQFIQSWLINSIFTGSGFLIPPDSQITHNLLPGPVLGNGNMDRQGSQGSDNRPPFSREWGHILHARVSVIIEWAESNNLELSVESQFQKIEQLCHLLKSSKCNHELLSAFAFDSYSLNSIQVHTLLSNFRYAPGEPSISQLMMQKLVLLAHNNTDVILLRGYLSKDVNTLRVRTNTNKHVNLLEDDTFWTLIKNGKNEISGDGKFQDNYNCGQYEDDDPSNDMEEVYETFILPERGYSFDIVQGVPDALSSLIQKYLTEKGGIAKLIMLPPQQESTLPAPNHHGSVLRRDGTWNIYLNSREDLGNLSSSNVSSPPSDRSIRFNEASKGPRKLLQTAMETPTSRPQSSGQVEVHKQNERTVTLTKTDKGLGLSIVAAQPSADSELGIYIKAVITGGAADLIGSLRPGYQILAVNGISLVGVSQEIAANIMARAGKTLTLTYNTSNFSSPDIIVVDVNQSQQSHHLATTEGPIKSPSRFKDQESHNSNLSAYKSNNAYNTYNISSATKNISPATAAKSTGYSLGQAYPNAIPGNINAAKPSVNLQISASNSIYSGPHTNFKRSEDFYGTSVYPNSYGNKNTLEDPRSLKIGDVSQLFSQKMNLSQQTNLFRDENEISSTQQFTKQPNFLPINSTPSGPRSSSITSSDKSFASGGNKANNFGLLTNNAKPQRNQESKRSFGMNLNSVNFTKMASEATNNLQNREPPSSHESPLIIRSYHHEDSKDESINAPFKSNIMDPSDTRNFIGARQKIAFCQEMINELKLKGDENLNGEECEKLKALVMEFEFQRRVLEEEESSMSEDDEVMVKSETSQLPQPTRPLPLLPLSWDHHLTNSNSNSMLSKNDQAAAPFNPNSWHNQGPRGEFNNEMMVNSMENKPIPPERSYASYTAVCSVGGENGVQATTNIVVIGEESTARNVIPKQHQQNSKTVNRNLSGGGCGGIDNFEDKSGTKADLFDISDVYKVSNSIPVNNAFMPVETHASPTTTITNTKPSSNQDFLLSSVVESLDKEPYTPGVIGNQEVYLDPRIKLQMLKQKHQQQTLAARNSSLVNVSPFGTRIGQHPINSCNSTNQYQQQPPHQSNHVMHRDDQIFRDKIGCSQPNSGLIASIHTKEMSEIQSQQEVEYSPERMSFREKMKKFAQVSAQPPSHHFMPTPKAESPEFDDPNTNYNPYYQVYTNSLSNTPEDLKVQGTNPASHVVERLKLSKTQKKIEDSLFPVVGTKH